jgi:hypothetical protein
MTFPFRRKIEFYSSKSKPGVLEEISKLAASKKYTKPDSETVTGHFVIRTTNRLLFFNIVFWGNIYEFEGKNLVVMFAKMRLFVEVLLLLAIGVAGTSILYVFTGDDVLFYLLFMAGSIFLCGLFWAINYLQFKPALNSLKAILS